ncbi:MAG: DNA polymerase I [Pirellulales bacterium]|nr:DNA polymerase I [Pirellulales bacterium]
MPARSRNVARQALLPGLDPPPTEATADAAPAAVPGSAAGPPDLAGKTVWVIDANSLIFQVFHAIPEMTSPQGQPVNAVFGFTRDIYFLLEQQRPDYLFCAFDLPTPTFRHEIYAAYKEQRSEVPDDLSPQFAEIQRVLAAMRIPALSVEGYEADDILATLARQTEAAGGECFLVSGDKDIRQLLTPKTHIYNIRKGELFDETALVREWGVRPDQVVDFQALVGDSVDNVPGVPLVGPKIACELLTAYGTLDNLLVHVDEIKQAKRKANLLAARDQVLVSRRLVKLADDVPLTVDWEAGHVGPPDSENLVRLFEEYGFRGFTARARAALPEQPEVWQANYRAVTDLAQLDELVAGMRCAKYLSVDTETTHIWPTWADLVGVSLAAVPGDAWYIPVRSPAGEPCLEQEAVLTRLRPLLADPNLPKIGQNLKFDLIVLRRHGVEVAGVAFDTMLADYLLEAGRRNHNLDELSSRYLSHTTIKISELIGSGKTQKRMDEVPLAQITPYACEDADVALRLVPLLEQRLAATGLTELLHDTEVPLVEVLAELELNGIRVDVERLAELSTEYGRRLADLEAEIFDLAGRPFNIASPKQLQQVLFEEHKLPVVKKTKTGPSTDADVLEELARIHPLPAKIIEYRQYAKLKGTYVDALPTMVNPRTGRVHASFNQVVAATGRLSCGDPNLQNIPIRTEQGREIRSAFRPGAAGWSMLAADYSQIELRVLAHFSGDETLCESFARDEDIHARVAAEVNNVPLDAVTAEMRRSAKAVNFGVIYGQSAFGLAAQLDIPQDEAAAFIDRYFARYPGVERFLAELLAQCERQGYVTTILGRRRAIDGVRSGAGRQRNLAERTAINTVIQGSAADLIKRAMIAVLARMRRERLQAKMLLQIHDELVFEAPDSEIARLAQLVEEEMSGVLKLNVPLKIDVKWGPTLADV